jgi:ankyrin repeat protein
VDDTSSTFGDPTIEITQHIASDHMDMVRFRNLEDREYAKVAAAFHRIVQVMEENAGQCDVQLVRTKFLTCVVETQLSFKELPKLNVAVTEEERRACLDSLSFQQIDARLLNIKKAHDKTCKWLFEQEEYRNWLDRDLASENHGFLWIKGKPGAGKSTMMKHAFFTTKKTLADAIVISFFFNARGSVLEKATLGMYRSLLVQLLTAIPSLQDGFIRTFPRRKHSDVYQWNIEELQEYLITVAKGLQQHRLVCFIDALDECEENEVRQMVEFLERLGENAVSFGTPLNICLSSRHYPHISIRKGIELIMEGQNGHKEDIAKYVRSKFKAPNGKQTDDIKEEILNRAKGVFLWVVLVVPMLNKAYDHGQIHMLRRKLNEIPDELDKLFADILLRDAETRDESILCLQWLLFARRPLKREELYFAILSGTEPTALGEWDPAEVGYQTMDRFILSCSKGLAEVSKAKDRTVQFIHESVRDFFFLRNGLTKLQPDLTINMAGLIQERLKRCCYQYIMTDMFEHLVNNALPKANSEAARDLRERTSEKFPFLEYAVHNIFSHADAAHNYGILQGEFLKDFESFDNFKLRKWINLNNFFQRYQIRRYTLEAKLLYILSEQNLSNLIQALLDDKAEADVNAMGERYGSAIQAASVNGYARIVRLLIDAGANVNILGGEYGHTLIAAMAKDHVAVVELLLGESANPRSENKHGETPLLWAAKNGHGAIAQLLLANPKVDPDPKDKDGRTPLWYAVRNGHEAIVQLLLVNPKVDPDPKDDQTPLWYAVRNRHEAIAQLLLAHPKIDLNSKDKDGQTPLGYVARDGHEAVVKLLLARADIEVNSKDRYEGRTPLSWAAGNEHGAAVELLLMRADVEGQLGRL